jgi:hypothetical protein
MIRCGNQIRLTRTDVERFTKITGFVPAQIKTLDDLDSYIRRCKQHYWGISNDTQFLHWLIDRERGYCINGR